VIALRAKPPGSRGVWPRYTPRNGNSVAYAVLSMSCSAVRTIYVVESTEKPATCHGRGCPSGSPDDRRSGMAICAFWHTCKTTLMAQVQTRRRQPNRRAFTLRGCVPISYCRTGGYATCTAGRISSNRKGSTKQFGWLQASATTNYSASISFEYPATIRIDSPPYRNIVEAPTVGHSEGRDSVYLPKVPK
jgi:hypothetical protein